MASCYVIEKITPKGGAELRKIHRTVLGRRCVVVLAEEDRRGRFVVELDDDYPMVLHTSIVEDVSSFADGDRVRITTANTVYELSKTDPVDE